MATRRGNGEGNVRFNNGRYEARLRYTDPLTGQSKRASVYGPTAKAARDALKQLRERLENGQPARDSAQTVGAWLTRWREVSLQASTRKESTKQLYGTLCRLHLETPPFGDIRLDRLRPSDVEALVLRMRQATKPAKTPDADRVRAFSDSTIRQTFGVLRAGLDGAVRDGLLARNPAAQVQRPGVERVEARHLDADDVARVLSAAASSRYHPALMLIATTGLRRGEALGLKWSEVDLDAGVLTVRGTLARIRNQLVITEPKTARSRREVPLHPGVVTLLRRHRTAQKQERMRAANKWTDHGLVFATEHGGPVDPRNLLRVVEVAAKTAGVDGVGVHTLRHSAAVSWLEQGVHIKAVADLLGHSSIAVTGDVYGHSSDATARAAVQGLGARLGL